MIRKISLFFVGVFFACSAFAQTTVKILPEQRVGGIMMQLPVQGIVDSNDLQLKRLAEMNIEAGYLVGDFYSGKKVYNMWFEAYYSDGHIILMSNELYFGWKFPVSDAERSLTKGIANLTCQVQVTAAKTMRFTPLTATLMMNGGIESKEGLTPTPEEFKVYYGY